MKNTREDIKLLNNIINRKKLDKVDIVIKEDGSSNVNYIMFMGSNGMPFKYTGEHAQYIIKAIKDSEFYLHNSNKEDT